MLYTSVHGLRLEAAVGADAANVALQHTTQRHSQLFLSLQRNQSVNQSISQPTNQSVNQPVCH
jgi:hypothetical protein